MTTLSHHDHFVIQTLNEVFKYKAQVRNTTKPTNVAAIPSSKMAPLLSMAPAVSILCANFSHNTWMTPLSRLPDFISSHT